ncbi:MAG: SHOCT domain-containing protein [Roseburia sp.]|nr:SHOCT domain-containing protein [Roseburia sp.]MCM1279454.1 SHOCT domain-containing protein [Robinsoniella sp.]
MKCLICSGDSAGEVCNKCIRLEKILYQKEWSYKEGMFLKKSEDYRIAISNMRISGRVAICDNPKGLNSRLDNMSHYLMNVKECTQVSYQGKKTLMIGIENNTGENARYSRYCFLPGFDDVEQLVNAIFDAKKKAASLTERIRQSNGISTGTVEVTPTQTSADIRVSAQAAAPTPAPAPAPMHTSGVSSAAAAVAAAAAARPVTPAASPMPKPAPAPAPAAPSTYDTVALSGLATDINEFETKIKKLKVLRDNGILSEEEYLEEKKKLVSIF